MVFLNHESKSKEAAQDLIEGLRLDHVLVPSVMPQAMSNPDRSHCNYGASWLQVPLGYLSGSGWLAGYIKRAFNFVERKLRTHF